MKNLVSRNIQSVLITGVSGSAGSYLAEYIVHNHPSVKLFGTSRWHSTTTTSNLSEISDSISMYECDLSDMGSIIRVLATVQPDVIFHLASYANVRTSFDTPVSVVENNIMGTINLLEAVRLSKVDPIIQISSTSEVYGQVDQKHIPIDEDAPLLPASPYAVSKVCQDLLARSYFVSYGMRIIRTRMFAYLNPRRTDLFATSFARQVARVEIGLQEQIEHGNLDSVRTLLDVRDAVRAYWKAVQYCTFGETYNVGSTKTNTVGQVLEQLIEISGKKIKTRLDEKLLRPADVTLQVPNVEKFVTVTGWQPKYNLDNSLRVLLEFARKEVKRELAVGTIDISTSLSSMNKIAP